MIVSIMNCEAQPVLTANDSRPTIGELFTYSIAEDTSYYHHPEPSQFDGPNQFWDYSHLKSTHSYEQRILDPSSCNNNELIPYSDIVISYSNWIPGSCTYIKMDSESFQNVKHISNNYVDSIYQLKRMVFPFTYLSEFGSGFKYVANSYFNFVDTVYAIADAYGTLKLPNTTYKNVLRIKQYTYVSNYTGYGISVSNTYRSYLWYVPGIFLPVLTSTMRNGQYRSIQFLTNSYPESEITFAPNPFTDQASIQGKNFTSASAEMYDMRGNHVRSYYGIPGSSFIITREGIANGIYILKITEEFKDPLFFKVVIISQ